MRTKVIYESTDRVTLSISQGQSDRLLLQLHLQSPLQTLSRMTAARLSTFKVILLILTSLTWALPQQSSYGGPSSSSYSETIDRDVAVIGGGSSGTYAAVRLKQKGKSVVVIEAQDRLGGHTETYKDPATGIPINLGVVVWDNIPVVQTYADSLGVPLSVFNQSLGGGGTTAYVDLRTGKPFTYAQADPTAALGAYAQQLAKYPYLNDGYNLPDPVPEDLLLPFGQFVQKYNLGPIVPIVFNYGQGAGDLLNQLTLFAAKLVGLDVLDGGRRGFLVSANGDQHAVYDSASKLLGADVLLNSQVVRTDRSGAAGVTLVAQTPSGRKRVRAKKLVIAIQPTPDSLAPLDPSPQELALFRQLGSTGYYTGLLKGTGLPPGVTVSNGAAAAPYQLPPLPATYSFYPSGAPGLLNVKYGSAAPIPDAQVKGDIFAELQRLKSAGYIVSANPELVAYHRHVPFFRTVPADAIRNGFYRKANALQGQRHTFYTGAAWQTQNSALLWNFTEYDVLPRVLA